jgi:hypothetical protein
VAVALVALVGATKAGGEQDQAPAPTTTPSPVVTPTPRPRRVVTVPRYLRALRFVYGFTHKGGIDYRAWGGHHRGKARLHHLRSFAKGPNTLQVMRHLTHHRKKRWRKHVYVDAITPYGAYAIPGYIVMRESHGDPCAANSQSTAGGLYQFIDSTFYSYGGSGNWGPIVGGYSHPAACAPVPMQDEVAFRAWAGGSGSSHWAQTR